MTEQFTQPAPLLMLPEKKLTYDNNGILFLVDGELNPCFFHYSPDLRTPEQKRKDYEECEARCKVFRETKNNLYHSVKHITITFKDGHIALLDPKDKEYGWRIRWSIRDLLAQAVVPKKLGFSEFGTFKRPKNHD